MQIQKFEDWKNEKPHQLNEGFFDFLKSIFASLSEPVKKKVEIITDRIDKKTGRVNDAKQLAEDLLSTFKLIADDKKADLKGETEWKEIQKVLKEFIIEIKAVFVAAKVPFRSMVLESIDIMEEDEINEKKNQKDPEDQNSDGNDHDHKDIEQKAKALTEEFTELMTSTMKQKDFEKALDKFLSDWIDVKFGKNLVKEASKFIDNLLATFKKKIQYFGPERLQSLIELSTKNPNAKKADIEKALKAVQKTAGVKKVTSDEYREKYLEAIKKNSDTLVMTMMKNKDGSHDITFKNVKI